MFFVVNSFRGGSPFVAFADDDGAGNSMAAISKDSGVTWSAITLPKTDTSWFDAVWNGSKWIAIGESLDTGMTSTDGESWSTITLPTCNNDRSRIRWNGSYFLAVNGSNSDQPAQVTKSADGSSWALHSLSTFFSAGILVWSPDLGLWVAVTAGSSTNVINTSSDGETWTNRTATSGLSEIYKGGYWGGTKYVLVGQSGFFTGKHFATSTTGISGWVGPDTSAGGNDVAFNGTVAVAVFGNTAYVTDDEGATWTSHTINPDDTDSQFASIAWNGQWFCSVAYNSTGKYSAVSKDGTSWTVRDNLPTTDNWLMVRAAYP